MNIDAWILAWAIAVYVVMATMVAEGAGRRGRSYLVWAAYSLLVTPILAALSLWLIGSKSVNAVVNAESA